jgi:2-phosphosulfolactate phosphatase
MTGSSPDLFVDFLPPAPGSIALSGGTAVVIDVLRASSTIVTALHHGARRVIPCTTTIEAFAHRTRWQSESPVLLGGERGGMKIDGFDLGNSPAEYSRPVVAGKTVVFTTTNGTRAMAAVPDASRIMIGCFLNRSAVLRLLQTTVRPVRLVCAGTDGRVTGEDVLFAGAVADSLLQPQEELPVPASRRWIPDDSALVARSFWRTVIGPSAAAGASIDAQSEAVAAAFRDTTGGLNLRQLKFDDDLRRCSRIDLFDNVPELDRASGLLV